jgi:hypothetical protein
VYEVICIKVKKLNIHIDANLLIKKVMILIILNMKNQKRNNIMIRCYGSGLLSSRYAEAEEFD